MTPEEEKRIRLALAKHAGRDLQSYIASQHDVRLLLAALDEARRERDALREAAANALRQHGGMGEDIALARLRALLPEPGQ